MNTRDFTQSVVQALHLWNVPVDESPFERLALYQVLKRANPHERPHRLVIRILEDGLQELTHRNTAAAALLRQRFYDERVRKDVARGLAVSVPHLDRLQREAIRLLAEIILEQNTQAQLDPSQRAGRSAQQLYYRLDQAATYDRLFGVDESLERLAGHLLNDGAPYVVAVEGLGGIGKTSLVIECLRRFVDEAGFVRFAFVTAQQQQLLASGDHRFLHDSPQTPDAIIAAIAEQLLAAEELPSPATTTHLIQRMQQVLRHERGLVVVDNLETIQALDSLLPALHTLSNPAKVLVTTRQEPPTGQPIHRLSLPELSEVAALALLRHHITAANVFQLLTAEDKELASIFAFVGGNPLALRLVVGQCHAHPLSLVLDDLQQARGQAADRLYTFIYRRAWDHLGGAARKLLAAMLLVPPQGADLALVQAVAGLDEAHVRDGLTELVRCSLVNYQPLNVASGVYSLHSLTRTFLHRQVLRWT